MEVVKPNFLKFIWGQENSLCREAWAKAHRQEMTIEFWRMAHKSIRLKNKMQGSVSIRIKRYGKALNDRLGILDHSWCLWWERYWAPFPGRFKENRTSARHLSLLKGSDLKRAGYIIGFLFFPIFFCRMCFSLFSIIINSSLLCDGSCQAPLC